MNSSASSCSFLASSDSFAGILSKMNSLNACDTFLSNCIVFITFSSEFSILVFSSLLLLFIISIISLKTISFCSGNLISTILPILLISLSTFDKSVSLYSGIFIAFILSSIHFIQSSICDISTFSVVTFTIGSFCSGITIVLISDSIFVFISSPLSSTLSTIFWIPVFNPLIHVTYGFHPTAISVIDLSK
jgi:hypothetical protein